MGVTCSLNYYNWIVRCRIYLQRNLESWNSIHFTAALMCVWWPKKEDSAEILLHAFRDYQFIAVLVQYHAVHLPRKALQVIMLRQADIIDLLEGSSFSESRQTE